MQQDLSNLDVAKLHLLALKFMSRQATIVGRSKILD